MGERTGVAEARAAWEAALEESWRADQEFRAAGDELMRLGLEPAGPADAPGLPARLERLRQLDEEFRAAGRRATEAVHRQFAAARRLREAEGAGVTTDHQGA